jgi:ubiquinone biosynthesis protein UbiJ
VPTDPAAQVDAEAVALLMDWVLAGAHRQAKRDLLAGLQGAVRCETTGPAGGPVTIAASGEAVQVARGGAGPADATLHLSSEALLRWLWGRLPLATALEQGSVRLEGQRDLALAFSRAFGNPE